MRKPMLLGVLILAAAVTTQSAYAAKSITVEAPNGGETWCIGTFQTIKWKSTEIPAAEIITIHINRDGSNIFTEQVAKVPNTGSFTWKVTGPATNKARIRVRCSYLVDQSDSYFSIVQPSFSYEPEDFTVDCKSGKYMFSFSFRLGLDVCKVSSDDPKKGEFKYKYIYTLTNTDESISLPNNFIGILQLSSCDEDFCALRPRFPDGKENSNWNVTKPPSSDITWSAYNTQHDGVQPGKTLIFCLYSDQEPKFGSFNVTSLHLNQIWSPKSDGYIREVCAGTRYYWVPGCDETDTGGDRGCLHRFNIAQVYPVETGGSVEGADMACWKGMTQEPIGPEKLAIPGIFALATKGNGKLDVEAFVSGNETETCCADPVIQNVKLVKVSPRSKKCPSIFKGYTVMQNGTDNIRTWWPLAYTMPGTTFNLVLQGLCLDYYKKPKREYLETWCWTVVANPDTFNHLIDLFHINALGVLECPSIVGEDTYRSLKKCAVHLKAAWLEWQEDKDNPWLKSKVADAVIACEALITTNTLFLEYLEAPEEMVYPFHQAAPGRELPGNKAKPDDSVEMDGKGGGGVIGILDTDQNPAASKLIADLEYIHDRLGDVRDHDEED
jgi:hypothetical protein